MEKGYCRRCGQYAGPDDNGWGYRTRHKDVEECFENLLDRIQDLEKQLEPTSPAPKST